MAMLESIVIGVVILLMLLLLLILLIIAFKPWRFLSSTRIRTIKEGDLERPLVSDDVDLVRDQRGELARNYDIEGSLIRSEGPFSSTRVQGLVYKHRLPSAGPPPHLNQGKSVVLNVISEPSEDVLVGQTLKRPLASLYPAEELKHARKEDQIDDLGLDPNRFQDLPREDVDQGSSLTLEVISGPSRGLRCSIHSTNSSRLPLTLGRVSPSDLLIEDSEVSGKHAIINWNLNRLRWELVDMGSLNGTLLNSKPAHHLDSGSRHWGDPIELANGDVITLGTTSKIYVFITSQVECQIPFGVGVASDPMALRRGGKKLPMEDVCYYHWPLSGVDQFGMFGVCDGHGGAGAAKSASKLLPEKITNILSDSLRRERVLSLCDASDVLKDAFYQTEACMNHHYEGCTATVLLVWADGRENYFAQCANVGDSTCVMNIDGKHIRMSEDHRITSHSERHRIKETGEALKDGETRLCGLNLARMLGDKFLKQQDSRFSSEPYISQVMRIDRNSRAVALLASDGLWDVISVKKAIQLVLQARDRDAVEGENSAEKIATFLLNEARTLRTKDNTSIIFLDFDTKRRIGSCKFGS